MPAPVTSGQLRTNLYDMEIGDYIACKYTASSGAAGAFSDLGADAATTASVGEIDVAGSNSPHQFFYLVKTDKGMLLADRVIQSSISWDTLNAAKLIQGLKFVQRKADVFTSPTPKITASSQYDSATYGAHNATSGNAYWSTAGNATNNAWWQYEFDTPTVVNVFGVKDDGTGTGYYPTGFEVHGSLDGVSYEKIFFVSGLSFAISGRQEFISSNKVAYKFYKYTFTPNSQAYIQIKELLLGIAPIIFIRSLTGGVAFLGADGKPSTTCQWGRYTNLDHATGVFTSSNPYVKTFGTPLETTEIGFRIPLAAGDQTVTEVQIFDENNVNIAPQAGVSKIGNPLITGDGLGGLTNGDTLIYTWDNNADMDGAMFTLPSTKKISKVVIYGHNSYSVKELYLVQPADPSLNIGFFPPCNEFDTYIRKSNLKGTISAGDNNVWHHKSGVLSWCADTPMVGIDSSSSKIARNDSSVAPTASGSTVSTNIGFRPVFEFIEPNTRATTLFY